eukprot:1717631-Amphidinium_carterae.2
MCVSIWHRDAPIPAIRLRKRFATESEPSRQLHASGKPHALFKSFTHVPEQSLHVFRSTAIAVMCH